MSQVMLNPFEGEFNQLKFTCSQLRQETKGLGFEWNRVTFLEARDERVEGLGRAMVLCVQFLGACSSKQRARISQNNNIWVLDRNTYRHGHCPNEQFDAIMHLFNYSRTHPHIKIDLQTMYLNVGLGYTNLLLRGAALQFALRNFSIPIEEAYLLNIAADDMLLAIAGQDGVDRAYSVVLDLDSGVLLSMWTETRNIRIFPSVKCDEAAIREY